MMIGGALMGFSPQQVQAMSIQEYSIVAAGYSEAHGGKKKAVAISSDDLISMGIEGA